MKGPVQSRSRRFLLVLAPLLLGSVVFPAARSDAEEMKVSATTVAEGLKTIQRATEEVTKLAAEDKAGAEKAVGAISPLWSMIEATIRANDQSSYTALEHALEDLGTAARDGDARKAGGAAGALSSAVQFYVAKFPAGAASAAASDRTAAATPKETAKPKASAAPGERTIAAADDGAAAQPGEATLARTGPASTLSAIAGGAFGLGGLALIGGARRRRAGS